MIPQIERLNSLGGRILRVNALVGYKMGLFPAVMQAEVYSIIQGCKAILKSWCFGADAGKK